MHVTDPVRRHTRTKLNKKNTSTLRAGGQSGPHPTYPNRTLLQSTHLGWGLKRERREATQENAGQKNINLLLVGECKCRRRQ
jgi:hypothetical protein